MNVYLPGATDQLEVTVAEEIMTGINLFQIVPFLLLVEGLCLDCQSARWVAAAG